MVRVVCFELANYRRLRTVRLDLQEDTTVLVGANDSGKSSLLLAIYKFLAHATGMKGAVEGFSAFDISADGWATLIDLGHAWEEPDLTGSEPTAQLDERREQLAQLLNVMPMLDIWLYAKDGAWHLVRDLIPTLEWSGGLVGVRLCLQPVSSHEELDELIDAYRAARRRVYPDVNEAGHGSPRRAWPADFFDFLKKSPSWFSRIAAYKLDPALLTEPSQSGEALLQRLVDVARPIDELSPLRRLMRVDFISAQRGLGGEETAEARGAGTRHVSGLLTAQLVDYARHLLGRDAGTARFLEDEQHLAVARALEQAHDFLDLAVADALRSRIEEVRQMGYPGTADLQDIVLRAEVQPADALRHRSALQYRSAGAQPESMHLPEHSIGLGYQNLLSLSFALLRFRDERIRSQKHAHDPEISAPAVVHLVLLEEPEAHLHVQVQRTFIKRARERLIPTDRPELSTQLVVTTHSSHLAHAVDFANLRYIRRKPRNISQPLPTSVVVSLSSVFGFDGNAVTDTLRFVQRYLRVQHNDLLFADGVVMIEGTAERILIPAFIERDSDQERLRRRYLSILEVGGSHAHRLLPLLKALGLPTLLITDLDPTRRDTMLDKSGKSRTVRVKSATSTGTGQESANPSIRELLHVSSVDDLCGLPNSNKLVALQPNGDAHLRVAYQVPAREKEPCPTSLEDALVLENREWFAALPESADDPLRRARDIADPRTSPSELPIELHHLIGGGNFDKGAFALDLFMRLHDIHGKHSLACPRYIREGLHWLADELDRLDQVHCGGSQ